MLEPRADFYESGHPKPGDIFLIVEVADSTIKLDRVEPPRHMKGEAKRQLQVKIPLYAEDNVIEVWLVDINEQSVEVYRQPIASGYKQVQKLQRGQNLSIQRFPGINIQVDEILG